ncbi:MAG: DUF1464 family protein [Desulfurococcales archaeon]|jgi:predicted butyrate kinase (DUF1464 family)|nr:DUF1464 family protein [Desulfurococcales archaeon]
MRVLAIDPGTISTAVIVVSDDILESYREIPSHILSQEPEELFRYIEIHKPDLVVAPSGYGLPPTDLRRLSVEERLSALMTPENDPGIAELRYISYFLRRLDRLVIPVIGIPGVINLASVPISRKINRFDLGTADKVAIAFLASVIHSNGDPEVLSKSSFIVLELGAFTSGIAIKDGKIVDGVGGTLFPIGILSSGGWDGEVAVLLGRRIYKRDLFRGGLRDVCGETDIEVIRNKCPEGYERYLDDLAKTIAMLSMSIIKGRGSKVLSDIKIYVSGRGAVKTLIDDLSIEYGLEIEILRSYYGGEVKRAAEGAALYGLAWAGYKYQRLLNILGILDLSETSFQPYSRSYTSSLATGIKRRDDN